MDAEGAQRFLAARLEEDSLHASLWEEFVESPEEDAGELVGVLEALIEADPALARRLDGFVEEYHAVLARRSDEASDTGDERITLGDDALDTAVSIEAQEERESGTPYDPHSLVAADYDAEMEGEATYLYGNARSGDDAVGRDVGVEQFGETPGTASAVGTEAIEPATREVHSTVAPPETEAVGFAALDVSRLFLHISDVIADHPALDPPDKDEAERALEGYRMELVRGDAANTERMRKHLRALRRLAPDVAKALQDGLSRATTSVEGKG